MKFPKHLKYALLLIYNKEGKVVLERRHNQ